eukprot:gnl/TRDRNA2_/TRDRNA2_88203_c0_seq1.p1 gnl/TRDRNA2_/TRDRNA2_88203_c0~~gnl/TRDRNA2_/TRDRNA2_88203_c0_seq1.p1  ORF type:complete len:402 (+),score=66.99 gnl/TRDRNA2_/TRDRNA2_88203_c0_seq1:64-1269(+)
MAGPTLAKHYSLPDRNKVLEALIGLSYDVRDAGLGNDSLENIRVEGSEHYSIVEARGDHVCIVRQTVEPHAEFRVAISRAYYGGDIYWYAETEPWGGQEAFDAKQSEKKREEEERLQRLQDIQDARDAEAQRKLDLPEFGSLMKEFKYKSYRKDLNIRFFIWDSERLPSTLLTMYTSQSADGTQLLSFTTMAGTEIHAFSVHSDEELPSGLWDALGEKANVPKSRIKVILPDQRIVKEPGGLVTLKTLLGESTQCDAPSSAIEPAKLWELCTEKANFCLVHERGEESRTDLRWVSWTVECPAFECGVALSPEKLGQVIFKHGASGVESSDVWEQEAQKLITSLSTAVGLATGASWAIEHAYKSAENHIGSSTDWWVDHQFRGLFLSCGVMLLLHIMNKDMS